MGLQTQLIDTLFGGNRNPLSNILYNTAGDATSPNGVVTAPIGTFFVMVSSGTAASDDDVYINTDGATAWTLIYDASARGHIY
jgi:hypothetical protein